MTSNILFKFGTVIDTTDYSDGDRIRVYIRGVDPSDYTKEKIPYAFPLIPKLIHIKPKIGETVLVFVQDGSYVSDRFWIGPVISQTHKLDIDTITALSFLNAGIIKPDIAPSTNPKNKGVPMENDDVGLYGRGDSDIVIKPHEVRIRAGKTNDMIELNTTNQSYVQVKHNKENESGCVNIVADEINILSHKSEKNFNLNDNADLIKKEDYQKIIEKAHKLPYGDILIEFLQIFIKAMSTHVHAYHGLPPDLTQNELKKLLSYNLSDILAKNIRIN